MEPERIFQGLNPEQLRAVEAVRGPVCILAGAGSGKTTTITRRIANQVATRTFDGPEILAVTFTDKAAGEMRARLSALEITGVRARTFHSAALAQLHHLAAEPPGRILPSKGLALRQIANSLPKAYRFRPAADLAAEIEWAKNRRLGPEDYLAALGNHEPPIPEDLMAGVYRTYERRKSEQGLIDFEDVLEHCVRMFDEDELARERFRARYRAFTVDEYQDVNLLQRSLLERWLGGRDDLCVVGDDYQSIYSFTGASPQHLLEMPRLYPRTLTVRLERNYRSSPEILAVGNRLVAALGGAKKVLTPEKPSGPQPTARCFDDPHDELDFIVRSVQDLHRSGVAFEDMGVLYRANFRSEDYEERFAAAHIPFQVRGGAFLKRPAARRLMSALKRSATSEVAGAVRALADKDGYVESPPEGLGEQEITRQNDLGRLVVLAAEFDDGASTARDFVADLETRFGADGDGRGVNLLTYHRAKGLEFQAVLLPRLQEGELPFKRARSDEAIAEERRLLYVGITRAKLHLVITWLSAGRAAPSRFVAELGLAAAAAAAAVPAARKRDVVEDGVTVSALKEWRKSRARADGKPAYVILHDSSVQEIAERTPSSKVQLSRVPGIGPAKLERYGDEILEVLKSAGPEPQASETSSSRSSDQ